MSFYGFHVPQDAAEAVRLWRKASDLGEPDAMTYLGLAYRYGRGVAADEVTAKSWLDKASRIMGDAAARKRVAELRGSFETVAEAPKLGEAETFEYIRSRILKNHAPDFWAGNRSGRQTRINIAYQRPYLIYSGETEDRRSRNEAFGYHQFSVKIDLRYVSDIHFMDAYNHPTL